jgi:hypothetical protein
MERMALDRLVIPLKEIGELQMGMRGNCQTSLAMYLIDHTRCILVRIDSLLQIDTQDVIIFEKVTDLKAGDYEKVVGLFSPKRNLFDLMKIGLHVLYRLPLLTESEAYGRLSIKEMVGNGNHVKAGFSVCLDDFLDLDRSVAEGGMNVKVSQEPFHHYQQVNF